MLTIEEVHAAVSEAVRLLSSVYDNQPPELSDQAGFDIGRACGMTLLAKVEVEVCMRRIYDPHGR